MVWKSTLTEASFSLLPASIMIGVTKQAIPCSFMAANFLWSSLFGGLSKFKHNLL